MSKICDKNEMDGRPGGAAEPPAPEAYGAGGGVLGEGVGGSAATGPGFHIPTKNGGTPGSFRLDLTSYI